ncbi:hypothetical protein IF2G_09163 [Cordyceps javanica]|nr:hypothetical protein IF2G_09163 [Cordyceps javanica]
MMLVMNMELQERVQMTINCCRCLGETSNQNLVAIIHVSLSVGSLLPLFERQQQQHHETMERYARGQVQFSCNDQYLIMRSLSAVDVARRSVRRSRVQEYCRNVISTILTEFNMLAGAIMQGVNSIFYKHRTRDIHRRARNLSATGRLHLAAQGGQCMTTACWLC